MTIHTHPTSDSKILPPTHALAQFVAAARTAGYDARSLHRARYHTLDTLGAILAASGLDATNKAADTLVRCGASGDTPVPGRSERFSVLDAAFVAGTAGHGLELDDGYRAGSVHPGTVVVPAALAAAHAAGCDGARFVQAIVAGYEVICRLSAAIHPRARWRGFHNTPVTGVFGAAAVWAVIHDFDAAQVEDAFGAACSQAGGLFTFLQGGEVKRTHPGFGARAGLLSGALVSEGLSGPPGCLESPNGFFHAYAGGDDAGLDYTAIDILGAGKGSPLAMTECYIKPHACCRHIHGPIDALQSLMREHELAAKDIAGIHVGTYKVAAAHDLPRWPSFTGAQMSIPFVLATTARFGRADLDLFGSGHRADPETAAMAERVSVSVDPECEADYPKARPARVTVTTGDGRTLSLRVDEPYGSPSNPLDDGALEAKFLGLASPILGDDRAAEIAARFWALDQEPDMRPLIEALAAR